MYAPFDPWAFAGSGRRVACTIAFLGYGAAHAQESIWNGRSWVVTLKHLFDSVIYAVLTTVRRREWSDWGIATWPVKPRGQRSRSTGADRDTTLRREAASFFVGLGKPLTRFLGMERAGCAT
jgi:hypothetical protein